MPARVTFKVDRGRFKTPKDARGRFTDMSEFNIKMLNRADQQAEILRAAAGSHFRESLVRPGESTGRLERAHSDKRNTFVTPTTVGIGRSEWLDKVTADQGRYWRLIEEGTTMFVGRQLTIVPNSARGTRGRTPQFGRTSFYKGSGQDPGLRMVNKQNVETGFGPYRRGRDSAGRFTKGPRGNLVIKKPIQAHGLYDTLARTQKGKIDRFLLEQARLYFEGLKRNL